jgi:hypothetical protein
MNKYSFTFSIWGNAISATVFADDEAEAIRAIENRYLFMDEGSLSLSKESFPG